MITGKIFMNQLEKFLQSPTCSNARVQVKLPQGEFHSPDGYFDVTSTEAHPAAGHAPSLTNLQAYLCRLNKRYKKTVPSEQKF